MTERVIASSAHDSYIQPLTFTDSEGRPLFARASVSELVDLTTKAVNNLDISLAMMADIMKEILYDVTRQQLVASSVDLTKHSCFPYVSKVTGRPLYP